MVGELCVGISSAGSAGKSGLAERHTESFAPNQGAAERGNFPRSIDVGIAKVSAVGLEVAQVEHPARFGPGAQPNLQIGSIGTEKINEIEQIDRILLPNLQSSFHRIAI